MDTYIHASLLFDFPPLSPSVSPFPASAFSFRCLVLFYFLSFSLPQSPVRPREASDVCDNCALPSGERVGAHVRGKSQRRRSSSSSLLPATLRPTSVLVVTLRSMPFLVMLLQVQVCHTSGVLVRRAWQRRRWRGEQGNRHRPGDESIQR